MEELVGNDGGPIVEAIKTVASRNSLIYTQSLATNCLELHTGLQNNLCTILVGANRSGKSTTIQCLAQAVKEADATIINTVNLHYIYPNAVEDSELFGEYDVENSVWKQGILPYLIDDKVSPAKAEERNWLVLDGTADSPWIDKLDSLIDEYQQSYVMLANGAELRLPTSACKVLLELTSLVNISPATISKVSMKYFEQKGIEWQVCRAYARICINYVLSM